MRGGHGGQQFIHVGLVVLTIDAVVLYVGVLNLFPNNQVVAVLNTNHADGGRFGNQLADAEMLHFGDAVTAVDVGEFHPVVAGRGDRNGGCGGAIGPVEGGVVAIHREGCAAALAGGDDAVHHQLRRGNRCHMEGEGYRTVAAVGS